MKIAAVCIGHPATLGGRRTKTGILKQPVAGGVIIDTAGIAGDAVCNRKHHGGPDQAIYGLGSIDLEGWAQELGRPVAPGLFGENLVIEGVDSRDIAVGDRFETASVLFEVTATRIPCATLSARMDDPGFALRFNAVARPGFYCRVLRPGTIAAGDAVDYRAFSGERVTMAQMLATPVRRLSWQDRSRYLSVPVSARVRAQLEAIIDQSS